MCLSLIAFWQSTSLHISLVLSPAKPLPDYEFLFTGVFFVVWIPAVFIGRKIAGDSEDVWKPILQPCPIWMKFIFWGIFVYGFINGLFCLFINFSTEIGTEVWRYWRLRGTSGGMMMFYSAAAIIYYSFLHTDP